MDALKRAEIVKKSSQYQYDADTGIVEPLPRCELPTHQVTPENQQPVEKDSNEWEEELSPLKIQEPELILTEDVTESTVKNWTEALLFDTDDDDTPLQLEDSPQKETPSPPLIWEEAILPEFNDSDQPIEQIVEEPTVVLVEAILPEFSEPIEKIIEEPIVALVNEKPTDISAIVETPEIFSDTSEMAIPVVDAPENTEDVNFTEISTRDDHLKFTDWVDNYIDEDALRATHAKNIQEKDKIDEELSLLEELAEGTATHPNVAKRLLNARGKSPHLPKSTLRLLGLLSIVVVGLGGSFAYYYYSINTSNSISFNKHSKFTPLSPTVSEEITTTVSISEQPIEKGVESPIASEQPLKKVAELPIISEQSIKKVVELPIASEQPVEKVLESLKQSTSEKLAIPLKPLTTTPTKTAELPTESKTQLSNVSVKNEESKPIIPEAPKKIEPTLQSPSKEPVPVKREPAPVQTEAGIHTLHRMTKTLDNTKVSNAYTAFQQGDIHTAQRLYTQVLQTEPANRDALLGLAGISLQQGHSAKAQYYYRRVLELYPQDKIGQIGLINTLSHSASEYSESQLKLLLKESPQASHIHFSLGNLYVRQGQWAQAQQAYFSAYQYNSQHPDYAYNLAISLDQVNQPRLALSYYQKALQLTQQSQTVYHFDPQALQQRIKTLTVYYQSNVDKQ